MENIQHLTRQVAAVMVKNKAFYSHERLAQSTGLRPHEVKQVFAELQASPIYTLKRRVKSFGLMVARINDNACVAPFDAVANKAKRAQKKNELWDLLLCTMPVAS